MNNARKSYNRLLTDTWLLSTAVVENKFKQSLQIVFN